MMSKQWWWAATAAMALLTPGIRAQEHGDRVMHRLERVMELLEQEELSKETRQELKHLVASLKRELADQREKSKQRDLTRSNLERAQEAEPNPIVDLARQIHAARERAREHAEERHENDAGTTENYRRNLSEYWRNLGEDEHRRGSLEQAHEFYRRALEQHLWNTDGAKEHQETVKKAMEFLRRQQGDFADQAEALKKHVEEARRHMDQPNPLGTLAEVQRQLQHDHADLLRNALENAKKAQDHGAHAEALRTLMHAHGDGNPKQWIGELMKNPKAAEHLRDMAERIHKGEGALGELMKRPPVADEFHAVLEHARRNAAEEQPAPAPAQEDLERMMKELREELREVRSMVEKIRARARQENGGGAR